MVKQKMSFRYFWNENKLVLTVAIVVLGLFFPISYAHEYGHIAVCISSGFTYFWIWEALPSLKIQCNSEPPNLILYWISGGLTGMILSFLPLLSKKIRKKRGLLLGLIVLGIGQVVNLVFETIPNTHGAYVTGRLDVLLIMIDGVLIFALLWYVGGFSRKSTNKNSNK